MEGGSLADELRANGPLTLRRTLDVAEALLSALGAAYAAGIMHRDVKPANVMLGENGDVLITNFGIAVARTDPRLTRTTMVIGSPAYMAPERWQGAPNDGRSDLFSLGVTLYEPAEGVPPFPSDNPTAALTETPRAPQRAGHCSSPCWRGTRPVAPPSPRRWPCSAAQEAPARALRRAGCRGHRLPRGRPTSRDRSP
ncbi:serine/threonine-protein kinase [Streptomyces sp. NPDC006670]|uniref:serine/threonine-protein kinase n=1 Tax=Streptomyces sp. NPDC006670 TaxID=3154476 RepID=UPI0033C7CF2C